MGSHCWILRICGLRDESSLNSEAATHQTSSTETPGITQQERDALAGRIAAVLRKRKKLGAERRVQELEYQRLNRERALARHYRLRGEYVGGS